MTETIPVDQNRIEEEAEWLYENTPLTQEQARVVACREARLSQTETAKLLDKNLSTVNQLWRQARERFEESRRLTDVYGAYFFSDWRA